MARFNSRQSRGRGRRHPSFCPGIFFGIPRLRRPEPRPQSKFGSRSPEPRSPLGLPVAASLHAAQRSSSGSKCAATANASRTYMPELYRLIRSLPLISPFRLPAAVARAASQAAWMHRRVDIPSAPGELNNLIELPRNLVCSHPGSQSPSGLPAAAYLGAAHRLGSAFRIPRIAPFRKMFSRPVNSG